MLVAQGLASQRPGFPQPLRVRSLSRNVQAKTRRHTVQDPVGPLRLLAGAKAKGGDAESSKDGAVEDGGDKGGDPLMEAIQVMREQGIRFEMDEEEEEDWDDILEDLDDPWMREPAPALEIEGMVDPLGDVAQEERAPIPDAYSPEGGFVEITVQQLRQELNAVRDSQQGPPITVIDVRSTVEYAAGNIPGSIHIPLSQLSRESVLPVFIGHRIMLVGSGEEDDRSRQAFVRLVRVFGFTDVSHILGGMSAWSQDEK